MIPICCKERKCGSEHGSIYLNLFNEILHNCAWGLDCGYSWQLCVDCGLIDFGLAR